ncbi:phosphoglucosamine mutase [Ornithinimicrobium cryptoxanthini]|uniref:Phosphoglucosamine mutase n=1 Tax=Ornithinimicrobium cryptoxanthini TaxID=2934161 RepID=A0ABY4YLD8_9MICO|nr:phosphoglucosamine mutase [Ornithinimicrobium cryptoxanthini]USQ77060.1 phosphoglucosamine mutase [Ornithinimicrobium cryptoxanthini]
MTRLFGTDGVRGLANKDITAELALKLSVAVAHELGSSGTSYGGRRASAVVGRDPRASGEFLSAAVMAGFASAGVDVLDAGVLPTPAIAYLTARMDAEMGAVLSASHNAMPDNGIKFFAEGGHKLADHIEDAITQRLDADWERPTGVGVGRIRPFPQGADFYMEHLLASVPGRLDGLHVVIDAAHGAASHVGPEVFRRAGATVDTIGGDPDGLNINDGYGSTHMERLQQAVVDRGADLGFAFDGDADRCLAVDADGNQVDGDQIMAVLAVDMRGRGTLANNTLVATVMSNLGLLQAMERQGIAVVQTAVGDRYVLEEMRTNKHTLGGEQSGHVIMLEHGTTGDGVLTALAVARRVRASESPLAQLTSVMHRLPQVLINVKGVDKSRVNSDEAVQSAVTAAAAELDGTGRVLLRKSGTEPLVRVMVEADTAERAQEYADRLAAVVQERLAL